MTSADLYTGDAYSESYPSWHDEDAPWKAAHIQSILRRNACRPERIVEVGCGAGGVLAGVMQMFPAAHGVGFDISPRAIQMAQQKNVPRTDYYCHDFLGLAPDDPGAGDYDLLLCIDVFEHVENYLGFLRQIRSRAKYFVFHVPLDMNIKGLLRRYHMRERTHTGHLHYFDYMTAIATLEDTGYTILDRFYTVPPNDKTLLTRSITVTRDLMAKVTGEDVAVQVLGGASLLIFAVGDN